MEAATAAVMVMEDSPLFNAGRGSVLTSQARVEMDASIMDGTTPYCTGHSVTTAYFHRDRLHLGKRGISGAFSGARRVKNPILAARAIMEASPHCFIAGPNVDAFAGKQGPPRSTHP